MLSPRSSPSLLPRKEKPKAPESLQQARTLANLSRIGRAIHEALSRPPAFLVGPDGKPWHSLRVLVLPYLGHRDLFDQYDFSQPWDSAKNLRLLDKMPAVYHDPIYGRARPLHTLRGAGGHGPGPKLAGARQTGVPDRLLALGLPMKDATICPSGGSLMPTFARGETERIPVPCPP